MNISSDLFNDIRVYLIKQGDETAKELLYRLNNMPVKVTQTQEVKISVTGDQTTIVTNKTK